MNNIYLIIGLIIILAIGVWAIYGQTDSESEDTTLLSSYSIVVHKTPTCGCCGEYVKYLKDHGANVTVVEHDNLTEERQARNIPVVLESCHFSEVGGYVVEGHVPAEAIVKLMEDQPEIAGVALPGMPAGSPGMGGTKFSPFVIHQFSVEGEDGGVYMTI